MTRDEVIRLAELANMTGLEQSGILENFERFAALVAAHDREACAELMEQQHKWISNVAASAAIRARGQ
jgi:hypothetical protein